MLLCTIMIVPGEQTASAQSLFVYFYNVLNIEYQINVCRTPQESCTWEIFDCVFVVVWYTGRFYSYLSTLLLAHSQDFTSLREQTSKGKEHGKPNVYLLWYTVTTMCICTTPLPPGSRGVLGLHTETISFWLINIYGCACLFIPKWRNM